MRVTVNQPILEAEKIMLKIGGKTIIKGLDLAVCPGDFLALLGPNGAGKSTLLKALALLLRPAAGKIRIRGEDGSTPTARQLVGFVGHGSFLYDRLSAWENLQFYGSLYEVEGLPARITALATEVGLYPYLHEPVATFSRGMTQRLAIARALLPAPEILLLDEPYTGLDQRGSGILSGMLRQYHLLGKTVLMTTHSFEQMPDEVNRLLILQRGEKILDTVFPTGDGRGMRDIYLAQVTQP